MTVRLPSLKSIFIHVLVALIFSFAINFAVKSLTHILSKNKNADDFTEDGQVISHAFCFGNNNTDRRCRFKNMCFKKDTHDFILFHHENKSVKLGIPVDRFKPTLVDLSSVRNHNRYYFNYIDVSSQSFKKLSVDRKLVIIDEPTIIFGRFKPDNLMHLLHDDVLPLFATVKQLQPDMETFNVFFEDDWHDFFDYPHLQFARSLYSRLIPAKVFLTEDSFSSNSLVCFKNVFVGVAKETTWYDYGFREAQGPLPSFPGQGTILRKTISQAATALGVSETTCSSRKIILMSRKRNRLIMNEREVAKFISTLVSDEYSVVIMRIEAYVNFTELASKVSCAKVILGIHGSSLALTSFLPADAGVLELFPFAVKAEDYTPYKRLAQLMSIPYRSWSNAFPENSIPHPDFPGSLGGINHLPAEQRERILQSTQVPRHRCCDDPEWLYRINQDTIVDLPSFTSVFKSLLEEIEEASFQAKKDLFLEPGRVSSLKCLRSGTELTIKWIEPWNLQLNGPIYTQFLFYEVLVQDRTRQETLVYQTNQTLFKVKAEGSQTMIWVRCHVKSLTGPFNSEPLYC